jgi:hypothetical protein
VIVERGPHGYRKEITRCPVDAREAQGLALLRWHVERLEGKALHTYEMIVDERPQLDPYALIGIVGAITQGASEQTALRMAGLKWSS